MSLIFPGDSLDEKLYVGGEGTYMKDGHLRASLLGYAVYEETSDSQMKRINIISPSRGKTSEKVINVGDIVVAQVVKLGINQLNVEILAVGDIVLKDVSKGVIRREDIRLSEVDKLVVRECFLPGDIIKAQVISLGDARQYYLSTAAVDLGVILAKSCKDGTILVPFSWKVILKMKSLIVFLFNKSSYLFLVFHIFI